MGYLKMFSIFKKPYRGPSRKVVVMHVVLQLGIALVVSLLLTFVLMVLGIIILPYGYLENKEYEVVFNFLMYFLAVFICWKYLRQMSLADPYSWRIFGRYRHIYAAEISQCLYPIMMFSIVFLY